MEIFSLLEPPELGDPLDQEGQHQSKTTTTTSSDRSRKGTTNNAKKKCTMMWRYHPAAPRHKQAIKQEPMVLKNEW